MDEFELFRAQAYSGGIPSTKTPPPPPPLPSSSSSSSSSSSAAAADKSSQYLHENSSSNVRRRRHSSAVVGQEVTAGEAAVGSGDTSGHPPQPYPGRAPRDRRHRLVTGASGHHHQSLDQYGSGYDPRDSMAAVVTVAVEPPSPTEKRRHQLNAGGRSAAGLPPQASRRSPMRAGRHQLNTAASSSSAAASAAVDNNNANDDDDDYNDSGDVTRPNVKRCSPDPGNKLPLGRRVTSPEAVIEPEAAMTSKEVGVSRTPPPSAERG